MYTFIMSNDPTYSSSQFNYTSPLASPTGQTIVGGGGTGRSSSGGSSSSSSSYFDIRKGTTTGTEASEQIASELKSTTSSSGKISPSGSGYGSSNLGSGQIAPSENLYSSQIQPNQVSPAGSVLNRASVIGTTISPPRQTYSKSLFQQAGREFFQGDIITSFRTLGSPLNSNQQTGNVKFNYGTNYGTIQRGGFEVKGSGMKTTTTGFQLLTEEAIAFPERYLPSEYRFQVDIEKVSGEIALPIQEKINTGQLSLEEGQKQFEKQFNEAVKKIDTGKYSSSDIFRSKVESAQQTSKTGEILGQSAGIGILSLTPTGQAIIGSSFVKQGTPKITKGLSGSDLTFKERGVLVGTGAFESGLGIAGGGFAVKGAERAADRLLVKELTEKQGASIGKRVYASDNLDVFKTTSFKNFGKEASIKTELVTPIYKSTKPSVVSLTESGQPMVLEKGEDIFSITGGKGVTKTKIFSVEKGAFIETKSNFGFQSFPLQKGSAENVFGRTRILSREGEEGFIGNIIVTPKGTNAFKINKVGGSSRIVENDFGKFAITKGGEVEKGLTFSKNLKGVKGIKIKKSYPLKKVKVQEKGIIKLSGISEESGIKILQPSKIKKTPLSATFQKQSLITPVGIAPRIEKSLIKQTPKIKAPTITALTKGGTKLMTSSKTKSLTPILPKEKLTYTSKSSSLSAPAISPVLLTNQKSRTNLRSLSRTIPSIKTSLATNQKNLQKAKVIPAVKQRQNQKQVIKTPSPLIPFKNKLNPRISTPRNIPFKVPVFKINLPSTKAGSSLFKSTRKSKAPSRTPSLLAIGRRIKSTTKGIGESSGLTIRPILINKRKKKKRMKGGKKKR